MTCIGLIALLWLTTAANFGGPRITGRIGSITVWGVIIPVGMISIIGWFWFSRETFAAAWNPQRPDACAGHGLQHLADALGVPRDGVRRPELRRRGKSEAGRAARLHVRHARRGRHLHPFDHRHPGHRAERRARVLDRPVRARLCARCSVPTIGSIIMALAVLACLGSLLGWQFTIAQTAKSAADERMFPAFFSKVNQMGAPVTGMIVLGVAQTLLALMTISPTLSEQFSALVNLAVVTNVVPYIIALSALMVMMRSAGVPEGEIQAATRQSRLSACSTASSRSTPPARMPSSAACSSPAIGFIIWGFLAPRFATGAGRPRPV